MFRVTKGKALFGAARGRLGGQVVQQRIASVARTSTTGTSLFSLPEDAIITAVRVIGTVASNAGTTATVNVGYYGGTGYELLHSFDVKGSGTGQQVPAAATLPVAALSADQPIQATYAETGTASTTGGPWNIVIEFVV